MFGMKNRKPRYQSTENNYNHTYNPTITPNSAGKAQTPFEYFKKPPLPDELFQKGAQQKSKKETMLEAFLDENGEYDFDKIMQTTNQAVHVFKQATPLFSQLTSFVTGFKK